MKKFKTFNDGTAYFYNIDNIALKGDKPKDGLIEKAVLRFNYETIGIKRNYEAMQADVKLDELISTPMNRNISPQDVVIINGTQYRIEQVQHDKNTLPPTSKYSLSRLEHNYDSKAIQGYSA